MYHTPRHFYDSTRVKIWYDENAYHTFSDFLSDVNNLLFKFAFCDEFHSKISKKDGPYVITYDKNGNITDMKWIYNGINLTDLANEWMKENNFDNWQNMCKSDFDRMWFEIL